MPLASTSERRPRRGNYSLLFGLMVPIMIGFGALGLDMSYLRLSEQQLQHVADAASHAAYVVYRKTHDVELAEEAAAAVVARNRVGDAHATLDRVEYGLWQNGSFNGSSPTINAARAELSRADDNAMDLFFAPIFGVGRASIRGESVTAGRTREIMIVQDITGSFIPDIPNARIANLAFFDYLAEHRVPGDKLGMTVFVGGTEPTPWSPLTEVAGNEEAIRARWATLEACNCERDYYWCIDHYAGYNHAPWMQDCFAYGAQTAQGPGIDAAVDELLINGDPTAFQAIIVVSDGLPCCEHNEVPRRRAALLAAERAWENGIHVWSVAFMNGGGDFSFLQQLVKGQGAAYETPNSEQLEEIMLEIAASIPVVLVK